MEEGKEITLEQLLDARERRAAKQKQLIERFKLPLISFTVNIPGPLKNTPVSRWIFLEGCKALQEMLASDEKTEIYFEQHELDTGHEAYLVTEMDALTLKAKLLQIEAVHPLGRLFDLDVIGSDGCSISRGALGHSKRKCLICEQDAHVCGRSRRHSIEELNKKIEKIIELYI